MAESGPCFALSSHQAVISRVADQSVTPVDARLLVDAVQMKLDGRFNDGEAGGDLLVPQAIRHHARHLDLARRERRKHRGDTEPRAS